MSAVSVTKEIAAPQAAVFACLSNIPQAHQVIQDITKIQMLTEGPVGEGTRWKETRVMFGKEATEELEITEFEPDHRYVVEAESCGAHYRTEIRIQALGDRSQVEMIMEVKPLSFWAKLMSPLSFLMKGMLIKCLEKDLEDCKTHCEQSLPDAAAGAGTP